jgi:capsular exopolysaccharide synthesis family protein
MSPLPPPSETPSRIAEGEIDFHYIWQVVRRRRQIIAALALVTTAAAVITVFATKPMYEAKSLVLIEKIGQNTLEKEGVVVESGQDDYYQTQYEIIRSRSLAERVLIELRLANHPEFTGVDPVANLQAACLVAPLRRTRLVTISAASRDPALAAAIANKLAERYVEQNLENNIYLSKSLLKAMDGKATSDASMESLPAVVNSPLIQKLKGQLADLKGEWADLNKRYQLGHPRMVQLKARLDETMKQINSEVRHIVESVRIQLSGEFKGNNVRIVDRARVPDRPARPRKLRVSALALLLGLAGGIAVAFAVDRWDLTVRSQEDVEHFVRVPCLAVMQVYPGLGVKTGDGYCAVWNDTRSLAAEGFRNLRTAVSFRLSAVKGSPVIQVTSSVQEEGKSFVSANLARAFAQAGEKVLLVDGDLRRPTVHKIFGVANETGLANFLTSGGTVPVVEFGKTGLSLVPCGAIPDNPAELLSGRGLDDLIEFGTKNFDRVIIDTPPVFPVTDSLLWARHAHGVLLVVRAATVRVVVVQRAHYLLKESFATVLGAVLNMATVESTEYYRYYHGYYNRYVKDKDAPAKSA